MLIDWMLLGARWIVRDNSGRAFFGDRLAEVVSIVGCITHDKIGGKSLNQRASLRGVTALSSGQSEPYRASQSPDGHMDFGAQAATGAANGRIFRPPFLAPDAC